MRDSVVGFWERALLFLLATSLGCGRIGFERLGAGMDAGPCECPDAARIDAPFDAGRTDAGGTVDTGVPLVCADLGGRACTVTEICFTEPVSTTDVSACCPDSECLDRSGDLVAEALRVPVVVDGDPSEWASATRWPITKLVLGTTPSAADFSGEFSVRWDDQRVYFYVSVDDDILRPMEGTLPWQDDTIELYLDLDPRTLDATWNTGETWCYLQQDGSVVMGTSVTDVFPTTAAFGTRAGGWFFEAGVEWPGAPPADGVLIGLDVALNDHDGAAGTSRQNQLFWNDEGGQLYRDASRVGLLRLSGSATSSGLPVCGDTSCEAGENATNCGADC